MDPAVSWRRLVRCLQTLSDPDNAELQQPGAVRKAVDSITRIRSIVENHGTMSAELARNLVLVEKVGLVWVGGFNTCTVNICGDSLFTVSTAADPIQALLTVQPSGLADVCFGSTQASLPAASAPASRHQQQHGPAAARVWFHGPAAKHAAGLCLRGR